MPSVEAAEGRGRLTLWRCSDEWRRRLLVLFCVILFFCGIFPVTAHADNATVTSGTMYSYFQTFGSNGQWKDIQTPSHWITETGQVAYCLQTQKDSPYDAGYYEVNGYDYYNATVINGLQAILKNGYPANTGGWGDLEARYATANAIRFWLAENYCDGIPQYLNLKVNGDWIRGKGGYEELYDWALWLLGLARNAGSSSSASISFSPSTITLTQPENEEYFTGTVTVRATNSGGYWLYSNLPDGYSFSGLTGKNGDRLTITVPADYELSTYTVTGYGVDESNTAKLFFYAPAAYNQQRVVTCIIDTSSTYLEGKLTVKTPKAIPRKSNISITKTNAETGEPLAGVTYALYDAAGNQVNSGVTGSDGVVTFTDIVIGNYTYAETATLPNFVLDSTRYPANLTEGGITYTYTASNTPIRGDLEITKVDAYEEAIKLMGAGFQLLTMDGEVIDEGYTDASGKLTFKNILYGQYKWRESKPPKGFLLDENEYTINIAQHQVTVTDTSRDPRRPGTLEVKKQNADGSPLSGAAFLLEYSTDDGSTWQPVTAREDGPEITRGGCTSPGLADGQLTTDNSGKVTFTGLRADSLILYRLTETVAPEGMSLIGGSLYVGTLPIETENIYAEDAEVFGDHAFCYTLVVTATDDPVFRLPETGGGGFTYLPFAMIGMASPIILSKKRKGAIA